MNSQFLRQIFSRKEFALEYQKFIGTFALTPE